MSMTINDGNSETDFTVANPAEGKHRGVFSQVIAALHVSRRLQATREITRHRHLIDEAWAYEARNGKG